MRTGRANLAPTQPSAPTIAANLSASAHTLDCSDRRKTLRACVFVTLRAGHLSGARLSANSVSINLRHIAALALASAYLSGCLPVPWVYHSRPDVDG